MSISEIKGKECDYSIERKPQLQKCLMIILISEGLCFYVIFQIKNSCKVCLVHLLAEACFDLTVP